jgi:EmrB/QacA subfamily drug resistance transporter
MTAEVDRKQVSYPLLLITASLGGILAPLNSTMLAVALPELRREFDVGHAEIGWLVSAYLIAMAVAQPLGGRLGDQLGRSKLFRGGLVAFLILSIAAAFAPTFPLLVIFRTGQALVGAAVIPNGFAMVRESVPSSRLGQSTGFTGSAMSIAAAGGPLLGAALLAAGSWRWLFLINVPLVLLALTALAALHYHDRPQRGELRIDWAGAGIFAALLVAVTFALNGLGANATTIAFGVAVVGVIVFGLAFFYRQLSTELPVAEWRLFKNRSYAGATAYILLNNLVMYTTLLTIPFFVEEVQDGGSMTTGVLLGAMSILMAVLSPVTGRVSDSLGRKPLAVAGAVVVVAAMLILLGGIDVNSSVLFLGVSLALLGVGMGLSFGPASTAAIESAPREMAGAAAGTNSMMRYVGSIVGAGVLGAVLSDDGGSPEIGLFRLIFLLLTIMSGVALVATLFIHRFAAEGGEAAREVAAPAEGSPAR